MYASAVPVTLGLHHLACLHNEDLKGSCDDVSLAVMALSDCPGLFGTIGNG